MGDKRAPERATGRRLRGTEGLRGLAALAVLVTHVYVFLGPRVALPGPGERIAGGTRHGLTVFFVLSGLLLFAPFARALLAGRALPDTRNFLRNRALRILPAYWTILLLTAFVLQTATLRYPDRVGGITDPATLFANLTLIQTLRPAWLESGIGPAWSLSVEVAFYVALPLLAWGAWRFAGRGGRVVSVLAPVAALATLGLLTKVAIGAGLAGGSTWRDVLGFSFPAQADLFAAGMGLAVVAELAAAGRLSLSPRTVNLAAAGGFAVAIAVAVAPDRLGLPARWADTLCALGLAAALAPVALPSARSRLAWLLETRPLRGLGHISYSVYLWHVPVLLLLVRGGLVADDAGSLALAGLAVLAATLACASLTWRFVERPALAHKRPTSGAHGAIGPALESPLLAAGAVR